MVRETGETLSRISDEDLLNMKEMDSTTHPYVLKFYQQLVRLPAFWMLLPCHVLPLTLEPHFFLAFQCIFCEATYATIDCM